MQRKALCWLRLGLGLLVFAAGTSPTGGIGLVFEQIQMIGPRQWLNLMAGSIVSSTPAVAPIAHGLARVIAHRSPLPVEESDFTILV
jgi:hypothetical protein